MKNGRAPRQCELHDFAGTSPAAWRQTVPNGDQKVTMRHCRATSHHIRIELVAGVARQFERAGRAINERVEPAPRLIIGQAGPILLSRKGQDRLKLPSKLESDFRRHLVGTVGKRRNEPQGRRNRREATCF